VQRILNYYPNYPTRRLYFGEVETPYIATFSNSATSYIYIVTLKMSFIEIAHLLHTEKSFLNIVESNQIWIIITLFMFIWYRTEFR